MDNKSNFWALIGDSRLLNLHFRNDKGEDQKG